MSILQKVSGFISTKVMLLGAIAILLYAAACLVLRTYQTRLIFFPTAVLTQTPATFNLPYEDVVIPIGIGMRHQHLHGWWLPAHRSDRGTILFFHGNGGNISSNLGQAERFHRLGFSVLLIDYRGYGKSEGNFPSESQVDEDAEIAWNYLTQQRQIPPRRITLFGHSLGGAIAINLALRHPDLAGLIVQSSFTSMQAMVEIQQHYRIFPTALLLTQQFPSLERVRHLQVPVLYIHGTADGLLPHRMSQALYAATLGRKQLHLVAGANHNNVSQVGGDRYLQVLENFFNAAPIP